MVHQPPRGNITTERDTTRDIHRSSRDPAALGTRLEAWLASKLPSGAEPRVSNVAGTSATGMSSETVLFDATWTDTNGTRSEPLVARIAPDPADAPVFPTYDLERQFRVIDLVGRLTSVPVPNVLWHEPDPAVIGSPFFVMGRIDGEAPPDVMPYNFGDSWLYDADPADQRRLQDATVDVIAELHAIESPEERFSFLGFDEPGETPLRRHVAHTRKWYDYAAADVGRCELVDAAFAWLEERWPADEGPTVLCWGDARIGNVLYRDFRPTAVLDWEMAALGPRELDVAWLIYGHEVFEHLAAGLGAPGMPHFMREEEVASSYESRTGHSPRDLHFYRTYSALQYAIVFLRTGFRSVHFGERAMPAAPGEFLYNGAQLAALLRSS